ncbi:MAG: Na+/H+ antiporter subunit E [Lachnospiraceae bacterium]|nr:Na+/H+ antiporter subunit E [Lachnospiraceae bacterium]
MPLLLFILWIILNGRITPETVIFGLAVSAAVMFFMHKVLGYTMEQDLRLMRNIPVLAQFTAVLVKEILKASCAVIRIALGPDKKPDPVIVEFHSGLPSDLQNVLLANSITLTPGTYTLFQEKDHFVIHCLTREFSEGIEETVFAGILSKMEV